MGPLSRSVLAVCAHPDDESFGLGAVLHQLAAEGARTAVLCFTHGEASTLGEAAGLAAVREAELEEAGRRLGVDRVELLDLPDGGLSEVPLAVLAGAVGRAASQVEADLLLVFDEGGVTGHPDHCRATGAALAGAGPRAVLAWGVPQRVARALNEEFGTGFVGRDETEFDTVLTVDRAAQRRAISCHVSQCTDNPVLWRRLELLGDREFLRWLRAADGSAARTPSPRAAVAGPVGKEA